MKDTGYFYPDFDVRLGTEAIEIPLDNHKVQFKEYDERNKVWYMP